MTKTGARVSWGHISGYDDSDSPPIGWVCFLRVKKKWKEVSGGRIGLSQSKLVKEFLVIIFSSLLRTSYGQCKASQSNPIYNFTWKLHYHLKKTPKYLRMFPAKNILFVCLYLFIFRGISDTGQTLVCIYKKVFIL